MDTPFDFWNSLGQNVDDLRALKFVFPCIIPPGKHSYIIRYGKDVNSKPNYYYHTTMVDTRPEEIPPFVKTTNKSNAKRAFDKESSVF